MYAMKSPKKSDMGSSHLKLQKKPVKNPKRMKYPGM